MQPQFVFNLSHVHNLDSLDVPAQKQTPVINELKILTPPVSPNMYSPMQPSEKYSTKVETDFTNFFESDYGANDWTSTDNIKSNELFPELSI